MDVIEEEMAEAYKYCRYRAAKLRAENFAVRQLGDVEDVAHIAATGMLDAAARFDRARGFKFLTFAQRRIEGAIWDAAREAGLIRTPRLAQQRGEPAKLVGSLDTLKTFWERQGSDHASGWEPSREPRELTELEAEVAEFLHTLSRRERSIVRLYFRIGLDESLTMREIGRLHRLSESRVSQIVSEILRRAAERPQLRALVRGELVRGGELTRGAS